LLRQAVYKNFNIYYNNILDAQVDSRLYLGKLKKDVNDKIMFAILNSIFTYIGMELIGRTNLGEGALDIKVIDYKKIPVIDPIWLKNNLEKNGKLKEFLEIVDQLLNTLPRNIEAEVINENRLKMDELMLKPLGLNRNDVKNLYSDLIKLVKLREERAKSVKKLKKKKK